MPIPCLSAGTIDSFIDKNKDEVPTSLLELFAAEVRWTKALPFCCASTVFLSKTVPFPCGLDIRPARKAANPYYKHVMDVGNFLSAQQAGGGGGAKGGGGDAGKKTIVAKFNTEIEAFFVTLLTGATPKFIRCINPRPKGIPAPATMGQRFNLQRVLSQLRYTGG
eukprot:SAG22_NODE_61_length_23387_cov_34.380582_21_plen_165_part_00